MSGFNFEVLEQALTETAGSGVSFESQANKWETETEAKDLIDAINNCKSLEYLNLEGNSLGVKAASSIGDALKQHPEFKRALFKDLFTGRLKTEIPQALELMGKGMIAAGAQLTVLDCSDNALGPNGMVGLVELLKSPACYSLQELKLNNCGLGITGGKMLARALLDCYEASVEAGTPLALKVFIAGRNRLENDGAKALAEVFEKIQTLEEVAMPQNGIYHPGISALSEAFKQNQHMRVLNLNDNTIGPKGAEAIADALESMQNLEEINFGDCLLKSRGAVILGEALQDGHSALETLNLGFNEIDANGGLVIASAMSNKELLQQLNINGNQFGTEGREQIKELLEDTQRLHALDELDEDDSDGEVDDEKYDDNVGDGESENDYGDVSGDDDDDTCEVDDEDGNYLNYSGNKILNATDERSFNNLSSSLNDPNNSSVSYVGDIERPNTVDTFCNTPQPTAAQFEAIEDANKLLAFRNYLMSIPEKEYLTHLVFATIKCSAVSWESEEALKVATALYKDCYDFAQKTNQVARVNNFFLIQLGLLKTEDKFKPPYNMNACRSALKHAIESKIFADDVEQTFNLFLDKFN